MAQYPQNLDDWIAETFPPDTRSPVLSNFQSILDLWQGKKRDRKAPAWHDFEFGDFVGWYGWLCVFDITGNEPFRFHVRLWGIRIVDLMGHDPTGQEITCVAAELLEENYGYMLDDGEFFEKLQNEFLIGYTRSSIKWQFRDYIWYEEIMLPLATYGDSIDGFLTVSRRL